MRKCHLIRDFGNISLLYDNIVTPFAGMKCLNPLYIARRAIFESLHFDLRLENYFQKMVQPCRMAISNISYHIQ